MYGTIDTGAAVSIISESQQRALFPNAKLESSKVLLKTYSGEKLTVLGEMPVDVQYLTQRKPLTLLVDAQERPPLLGRNWLEHFKLNWKNIAAVYSSQETSLSLEKVLLPMETYLQTNWVPWNHFVPNCMSKQE